MYRERIISFSPDITEKQEFSIDFKSFKWQFEVLLENEGDKYEVKSSAVLRNFIGTFFIKNSQETLTIRFLSQKKNVADVERSLKWRYSERDHFYYGVKFEKFEIDPSDFVAENMFHVKISVKIDNLEGNYVPFIDFSQPTNHSDAVLVVNDHRLHVNKAYLALYSKYFETMFFSDFKEATQEEIVLEGLEYYQFRDLLQQMYPGSRKIEKDNLEYLLMLADRFNVPQVFQDCERYLISTADVSPAKKFIYADKFKMIELYGEILEKLKMKDFREIKQSSAYKDLAQESKDHVLQNVLQQCMDTYFG